MAGFTDTIFCTLNFLGKRCEPIARANSLSSLLSPYSDPHKSWFLCLQETRDLQVGQSTLPTDLFHHGESLLTIHLPAIMVYSTPVCVLLQEWDYGAVVRWKDQFNIALTHLRSAPANWKERRNEINEMLEYEPDLFIGDFNFNSNNEGRIYGMIDVWSQKHNYTFFRDLNRFTYDYKTNPICEYSVRKRIDRIYIKRLLYSSNSDDFTFILKNNLYISDHYPLLWFP